MYDKSVLELASLLARKELSSVELTKMFLGRIEKYCQLNAFLDVRPEITLSEAEIADKKIASGDFGPLTGIPVAHKDIFVTKNFTSTAGSKILRGYKSPFDATIVTKLKEAGMVTLGKLNCDEFAMGSSNENSFYGNVHNPWDKNAVPGGSSGGSASAVAARITPVATATDTGGSIREPASFCGVTGIKPTYGRASRWGMIAFASSLDQAGIICNSAVEAAEIFNWMLGFDPKDSTSLHHSNEDFSRHINIDPREVRLGIPKEFLSNSLSPEVRIATDIAISTLEKNGCKIVEISLPNCHLGIPVYYVLAPAECSSNLSRYDGVRYGFRAKNYKNAEDMIKRTRSEGFGAEPKRRIMVGTYVLSQGYYDAYYLKAQKIRRLIINDFKKAFQKCEAIVGPVTPGSAFNFGEKTQDPISMYQSDLFTIPASLAGIPAISIPCGFDNNGRPIGLQMMANYFQESILLGIADNYQKSTDWHRKIPKEFIN